LELTEWPLMFVIAVLVAWMADRRAATARTYEALFRRASDRLLTVQEDERIRLARDLHDGVGQTMTALGLILDALPSTNGLQTTDERLATARELARDALEDTRTLANRLRPARLEHVGLAAAVRTLGDRAGVPVQIRIGEGCAALDLLDPTRTVEAYRIVQEAIGNAARHSGAAAIEVAIDRSPAMVRIVVADNGVGFDSAVGHQAGLGIMGMRERAQLLRATFELDSAPGSGTRVILGVPVATIAGLIS
ncbi:MAG: sensor histidine kinase, partial [Chloroflexota bacterium]